MLTSKSIQRLNTATTTIHKIGEMDFSFNYGTLLGQPAAMATYMRVAADMIEGSVSVDLQRAFDSMAFFFGDWEEHVAALVLAHYEEEANGLVVHFGWTHPGLRRMGLFTNLMNQIIQCHWESAAVARLRVAPPFHDPDFDLAVAKLGFKPICLISEYRPYQ